MVRVRQPSPHGAGESQIVLEGYVDPGERRVEGPFGDHTGYYSLPDEYPVFHVTAMTQRREPIYPATIVGKPPMEDCFMAKATERIFSPADSEDAPGDRRPEPAHGGGVSQPGLHLHRQALPGPRPQSHARLVGPGTDDVHQDDPDF